MSGIDLDTACVLVHSRTTHTFPGVKVLRCHDRESWHVEKVGGMPTTTLARTIVDLESIVRHSRLAWIIDDAVAARRINLFEVKETLESVARKGKPGVRSLRAILDDRLGDPHSMSVLERTERSLLQSGESEVSLSSIQSDGPPSDDSTWRLRNDTSRSSGIRADGTSRPTRSASIANANAIVHGWRVLRFIWDDVVRRPDHVLDTVRATLKAA